MTPGNNVVRFSVSLPPVLVKTLDETCKRMGYENRSKAVHDAVRSFISEFDWMRDAGGEVNGALVVLYYPDKPGLVSEMSDIERRFRSVISSSLRIYVAEDKCMEIIAVSGGAGEIRELSKALIVRKGVRQVKAAFLSA